MKPHEIYHFYNEHIDNRPAEETDPLHIQPILYDMQQNDAPLFSQLLKLLAAYKKNLAVRVMDDRQSTLDFNFELPDEQPS